MWEFVDFLRKTTEDTKNDIKNRNIPIKTSKGKTKIEKIGEIDGSEITGEQVKIRC